MNNSISRILCAALTASLLAGCQPTNSTFQVDEALEGNTTVQMAGVTSVPVSEEIIKPYATYTTEFSDFLSYFNQASLPYVIGKKGLAGQIIDKMPLIKKTHVLSYLQDSSRLINIGEVNRYLNDNSMYSGKLNKANVEDKSFLHYLTTPILTKEYAAIVFCSDYIGLPGRTSVNGTSAILCTFTPKGKLISSILFARDYEGADAPYLFKNVITGTITPNHNIELSSVSTETDQDINRTVTKRSSQKYKIKSNGEIIKLK